MQFERQHRNFAAWQKPVRKRSVQTGKSHEIDTRGVKNDLNGEKV
jgi:hypothetical protein